jgi:hypothetical protein
MAQLSAAALAAEADRKQAKDLDAKTQKVRQRPDNLLGTGVGQAAETADPVLNLLTAARD